MVLHESKPPGRATIDRHINAMYPAIAMLAGVRLDVFTQIEDAPKPAEAIAEALGVRPDKLEPLLYALVMADLLTVNDGLFANTPEADHFLVRDRRSYIGGSNRCSPDTWIADLGTAETILTGAPNARRDFATLSAADLRAFFDCEHAGATAAGRDLVERLDLGRRRRLLDVAGGSGGLAIAACEACPGLRATVVDLAAVVPITRRFIDRAGIGERVRAVAADVVERPPEGAFDVAVLRNFIQVISRDQARRALRHVGRAVETGGVICIVGEVLDDSCLGPPEIAGSNYAFLNIYDEGRAYTEREHRDWLDGAGFADVGRSVAPGGQSVITARKAERRK